jgi:hypothetical protein
LPEWAGSAESLIAFPGGEGLHALHQTLARFGIAKLPGVVTAEGSGPPPNKNPEVAKSTPAKSHGPGIMLARWRLLKPIKIRQYTRTGNKHTMPVITIREITVPPAQNRQLVSTQS